MQNLNKRSKQLHQFEKTRRFAEERSIEFKLTLDFVNELLAQPCFMCGTTADTRVIARVDTLYGFHEDNVGACCWSCVGLRGQAPLPQLLEYAARWLTHRELIEDRCEKAVAGAKERRALREKAREFTKKQGA